MKLYNRVFFVLGPTIVKKLREIVGENSTSVVLSSILWSFGNGLKNEISPNLSRVKLKSFNKDYENYNPKNVLIDSGGFQIQQGYIPEKEIPKMIEQYGRFIDDVNKTKQNTKYFSLDIVLKDNTNDLLKLNSLAMDRAFIDDRSLFVFHFSSPKIFNTWNKIVNYHLSNNRKIKNWATGGLVSIVSTESMSFFPYILPLYRILDKYFDDKDDIYFHILGVTAFSDLLFMAIIENLINYYIKHKIYITVDSSAAVKFSTLQRVYVDFNNGITQYRVRNHTMYNTNMSLVERLQQVYDEMKMLYNLNDIVLDDFIDENGKMDRYHESLLVFINCYTFTKYFNYILDRTKEIIPYIVEYKETQLFDILTSLYRLTNKKMTKKLQSRITNTIKETLKLNRFLESNRDSSFVDNIIKENFSHIDSVDYGKVLKL